MILYTMGKLFMVVGAFMFLPVIVGAVYGEEQVVTSFGIPIAILLIGGLALSCRRPKDTSVYSTEGFVSVAASWIVVSLLGALPFVISKELPSYTDAVFETVSGFTTTGATIAANIEGMSRAVLFWRALTHWIGGMGILMFVLAIMSSNDVRTMHMMRAECAGPNVGRLVSRSSNTARILYGIYILLTVLEAVFLLFGGMPLYDSIIHACSSAGTGGFSIYSDSIGHYDSLYIEMVIAVFITLFGINFNLYYYLLIRKYSLAYKNEELRTYLGVIAASTLIIGANIYHLYSGVGSTLRHSFFMVASTITSTGFATADITQWPRFSQTLLLMLMFVGSCAGSTGGGLKVSRILILIKTGVKEIKYLVNPHAVATVKIDGKPVDKSIVRGVTSYVIIFTLLFMLSLLLIMFDKYTIEESLSAVITCMNNIGFGVGRFGPAGSFAGMTPFSKIVLSFDMLLGRLEVYPIIMLIAARKR